MKWRRLRRFACRVWGHLHAHPFGPIGMLAWFYCHRCGEEGAQSLWR